MKIISQHRALVAFAVAGLAVTAAQAQSGFPTPEWQWNPAKVVGEAVPPLPPPSTFPVQLVLDDDTSDGAFGVGGQTARQFLWFNRFSPVAGFHLDEVWVLFPSGANMAVGGAVEIAIYEDPDNDPTNGANLIGSFAATIQAADDNTFSIYPVPGSPVIPTGSDLLVGVVPRFIVSGVTSPTLPAALDTTATQSRSWVAAWTTDPPEPPVLVPLPDQTLSLVDAFVPGGGNFMIRAFGTEQAVTEIPALDGFGLAALALALGVAGALLLRRRKSGAAMVSLLVLALAAPGGAVTVDSFTTNQPALSDPGTVSSSVTGGAGDPIGTRRGMVVDLLTGAGPTTASVAAGNLVLAVTATTPDSRGEVLVSWDGDTNPLVLTPTGLANANLTTGNASGFQLDFVSTTVVTEIEITVYDDAANFSRAARRVPVSGAAQSVLIPFAEFRVAGGAGADFASVGAIEMTVRGGEGTITLNQVATTAPTVAATKVDTQIVDTDGDTRVDPGDRVRYTVTVTNTGNQALAVDLSDTVDANTTLVAGSVSSTPVAHNDQYGWFGNVTLAADGTPFPTLLANDADADNDPLTVTAFDATTAQGGSISGVNVNTGEFTYNPPAGFAGVDSFNYTISDNDAHTTSATAYIALEGVVWFVDDSNTTAPFNGTLADPFQTLASVNGVDPDQPGDIIFLYDDNGTAYPGGHVMEADQQFLGEGVGLILSGTTIVPAGGTPQMTNSGGAGITLGLNSTIRGLDVTGTSAAGIFGNAFGILLATSVNVTSAGGAALDLTSGVLGTVPDPVVFGTLSSSGTAAQKGLNLVTLSGSLTATTTTLTNPTTDGIFVSGSAGGSFNFGATSINDSNTAAAPVADGIDVATANGGASFTFSSLAVIADDGAGLRANGSGTINISGTGNTIASTGGAAVDVTSTSLGSGVIFATLSSTNSAGKGVNLDTVTGAFTGNGGSITGSTGICFDINGGSANITYAGTVSCNTATRLVEITNRTGGTVTLSGTLSATGSSTGIRVADNNASGSPIVNFSGALKTLNTGANSAVTLDNNDVATINFTNGGLAITTTSGTGFNAINGATAINVQGASNAISASGGTALNVVSSTIGASGLTFQSISANGGTNGIVLTSTGASGGLTVTGTGNTTQGGNSSGGTIQATTGDAIRLTSTRNVSLTNMTIQNIGTGIADAAGGIDAANLEGTNRFRAGTITAMGSAGAAGGTDRNAITVVNTNTSMTLFSVENSVFSNSDTGTSFIFTSARGTSNMGVTVTGSDFFDLVPLAVQVNAGDADSGVHTVTTNISNNTFRNASPANGQGGIAVACADQDATHNFTISGNQFFDLIKGIAGGNSEILVAQVTGGTLNGTISTNVIGNATAGNGDRRGIGVISEPDVSSNGELGSFDIIIDGNTIDRLIDREGIFVDVREDTLDSELIIRNNVIGQLAGFEGQVGGLREAVDVQVRGETNKTLNMAMTGNNIRTAATIQAVNLEVNIDSAVTPNIALHSTVTGNTIQNTGGAVELLARTRTGDTSGTVCLDMSGNTLDAGAGQISPSEEGGPVNVEQASAAALAAANGIPAGNVVVVGTPQFGVICNPPPV